MIEIQKKFSILISTKNRLEDLKYTLEKILYLIERQDVDCVVFDDGSIDGTFQFLKKEYPEILVLRNEISRGYIYCRNKMLNETKSRYAISLDDDANFITHNPLEIIENHFIENKNCALISFRIFWSKKQLNSIYTKDIPQRVKGFVGCGHVWKMESWKKIPSYPEWFVFYGEEEFSSYQLFKIKQEIHYLPSVLLQHRVNIKSRKNNSDYAFRTRRSLASGWYLYFLFYPLKTIPRKFAYSIWSQIKNKTFKGDIKATIAIFKAIFDVLINFPKLLNQRNSLTNQEYEEIFKLPINKIYWKPEDEK